MPNRILKESICTSEDMAKLSPGAEILFYRLMVNADDFGRFFANPSIVKSRCFQVNADAFTCEQVQAWLNELSAASLVVLYNGEDGRQYLYFKTWEKHQNTRAKSSKFPNPASTCKQMQANDSKCKQMSPYSYSYSYSYSDNVCDKKDRADAPRTRFQKPSLEEVKAYCEERKNAVDPVRFLDYYEANGWRVGKNPMKDWKAAVRTWEKQDAQNRNTGRNAPAACKDYGAVSVSDYDFGEV